MAPKQFIHYFEEDNRPQTGLDRNLEGGMAISVGRLREDKIFRDLPDYLRPGDVMVINQTKVIPARLLGEKEETHVPVEILLLKRLDKDTWETLVRPGRRLKKGVVVSFGGGILRAIGIDTDKITDRVVEYYPEIRNILYNYLLEHGSIDPAIIGDPERIGRWRFVPESLAAKGIDADMQLLFGKQ